MLSHIVVGLNPVLKIVMKIGMALKKSFSITQYFDDFKTAISSINNQSDELITVESSYNKEVYQDKNICDITGLKITSRSEWKIIDEKNPNNFLNTYLLNDNIYIAEWHGYVTNKLFQKSVILHNEICNEFNLREKKYFFLLEQSSVSGASLKTRANYLKWLIDEIEHIHYQVFVGLRSIMKFVAKSGMAVDRRFWSSKFEPNLEIAISNIIK